MRKSYVLLFLILALLSPSASADVIVFKNGEKIHVEKAWEEGDQIKASVYGGVVGYPKGIIRKIEKENPDAKSEGIVPDETGRDRTGSMKEQEPL